MTEITSRLFKDLNDERKFEKMLKDVFIDDNYEELINDITIDIESDLLTGNKRVKEANIILFLLKLYFKCRQIFRTYSEYEFYHKIFNCFRSKKLYKELLDNYEEYYNIVRSSMGPKKYSHISNKLRTAKKEIIDYLDYSVIKWKDYFDVVRISLFLYINEDNIN